MLIDNFMENCRILNKITERDEDGGTVTIWKEGPEIQAAIVLDNSTLAKIAEAQGVQSLYTITTSPDVILAFPDVIRRESDQATFQITSGRDKVAPAVSSIQIRQYTAKKWELTT